MKIGDGERRRSKGCQIMCMCVWRGGVGVGGACADAGERKG